MGCNDTRLAPATARKTNRTQPCSPTNASTLGAPISTAEISTGRRPTRSLSHPASRVPSTPAPWNRVAAAPATKALLPSSFSRSGANTEGALTAMARSTTRAPMRA